MNRSAQYQQTGEFIAESSQGRLVLGPGLGTETGVSIDSRTIQDGQVFFAIKGDRFDGARFLADALANGAIGLVVAQDDVETAVELASRYADRVFVVAVDDTTRALAAVATAWVRVLCPRIVGITGSVGKTTTKDLTLAALSGSREVHATQGNKNNMFGLSLTALGLKPAHEIAVFEMGMNHPGEIEELCRIAPPEVGLVTAVAPVHLEGLGSLDAVAHAKGELLRALPADGWAVLNADDPRVIAMAAWTRSRVLTFGRASGCDVRLHEVVLDGLGHPTATFDVRGRMIRAPLSLVGFHQAGNAAGALAVALAMGIDPEEAAERLAAVRPGKHRLEVAMAGTLRIIDDCYNASPRSVTAALAVLEALAPAGRRVAILGDLLELGDSSESFHEQIGREAARLPVDSLIAVGRFAHAVGDGAMKAGLPGVRIFAAPDAIGAAGVAMHVVKPRDTVLVKGSRGVGLEHVVNVLAAQFGQQDGGQGN
jgi:UDP-N-acetylmuramoyl-tripeptide--D-alanyl-D-alanine ligase